MGALIIPTTVQYKYDARDGVLYVHKHNALQSPGPTGQKMNNAGKSSQVNTVM